MPWWHSSQISEGTFWRTGACSLSFFCLILISCTYPSWKHALVQPVPKKGDRANPSNYRPIALTSAVAKVFETLHNSHFIKHLESNNLLSDHQYGFCKARSTGDLLSYLTHAWSSSLRNFGESLVVALDISKAFDRVWHKAVLAKLSACGFTPSFCKFICSNRILTFRIRSIRTLAKVGLVVTELLINTTKHTHTHTPAQLSFFAQPRLGEDLSLSVDCLRWRLFTFGVGLVSSTLTKMSIIFFLFFLLAMSYLLFTYVRGLVTPPSF